MGSNCSAVRLSTSLSLEPLRLEEGVTPLGRWSLRGKLLTFGGSRPRVFVVRSGRGNCCSRVTQNRWSVGQNCELGACYWVATFVGLAKITNEEPDHQARHGEEVHLQSLAEPWHS
jgi:hypothetical protein